MNKLTSILVWGGSRHRRRVLVRGARARPRRKRQRRLAGDRGARVYFIAYRFYSKFIAEQVLRARRRATDAGRAPQRRHGLRADEQVGALRPPLRGDRRRRPAGRARCSRRRWASCRARCGSSPASCVAGAVQDFIVLFASVRRDGKSLGEMIKMELGPVPGSLALVGVLAIMIIILAVLALVVVKALAGSPWGLFTIAATIPIALLMGVYMRVIRPGRVGEASVFGVVLLLASIFVGRAVAESPTWAPLFTLTGTAARVGADHLRRRRREPAGVADARAARLPEHVPEDRHRSSRWRSASTSSRRRSRCRRPRASSTAPGRCSPARCSRSCSSPSPAARCRASTR